MKGENSIRTAIVLVTSILLVSVLASGVRAAPPQGSGGSDSNSSGPVEISLDVGSKGPISENPFDDRFPSARQRPVKPHPRFKSPEDIVEGSTLELNLFEDTTYTMNVHTQKTDINDVTRIRGDIEGYEHGFVVLSIRDGKISGTIEIPEERERMEISTRYTAQTST